MSRSKLFLQRRRLAVCIALIVFSAFAVTAKTNRAITSRALTAPPVESVFNFADFDPVGDGVADDGPALQRALDALAGAGGGTLLIPAGSYRIATPVVKDFSSVPGAKVTIQGVPSSKMPAPVTAAGEQLAGGLDLTSEILPATGEDVIAITLSNLDQLLIEHVGFTGNEPVPTDAFITLYLLDIDDATIRHCEFYGVSSFGVITELGGGNIIRAVRSELSIELSVFLGCTANSGGYAPVVENLEWKKFSISNSIFLDYGLRAFFSKTGLGAPLSWIGIEHTAPITPDSPRREVIVRDTFLDEGGWVGISVLPWRWSSPPTRIDLIYISGLKMNVSNLIMTGHLIYDTRNFMVENSHYGWSHNAYAAIDINRVDNAILDKLTCIEHADRLHADSLTGRLTVINSIFNTLDSFAATTTVLETEPDKDPVQYVRQQFTAALGRPPDAAAHFYWSDLLIRCGTNEVCLGQKRSALSEYLGRKPQADFSIAGTVKDENGDPVGGVDIRLNGSHSVAALTDSQGKFRFSDLPTSGNYTVAATAKHYTFTKSAQTIVHPNADVTANFDARLNLHSIEGRILKPDGTGFSSVTVQLAGSSAASVTTDANGFYSFPELDAGEDYTVVPSLQNFVFDPATVTVEELAADRALNFVGDTAFRSLTIIVKDENGQPLSDTNISLSGSKTAVAITGSNGSFKFSGIPTSGSYLIGVGKRHYSFVTNSQTVERPTSDVSLVFNATLHRHTIAGRITRPDGTGISGITVRFAESPTVTTTDANGSYSFPALAAGQNYTVVTSFSNFIFWPGNTVTFLDLSGDKAANFVATPPHELITVEGSEFAIALDAVTFTLQPFSIFDALGLGNDGFVRVMIFAKNLEPVSNPSQLSVLATDEGGETSPVEVEFIGDVPGQSWLKQINLKLPSSEVQGKCFQLTLNAANVNSNNGRVCFGTVAPPPGTAK